MRLRQAPVSVGTWLELTLTKESASPIADNSSFNPTLHLYVMQLTVASPPPSLRP